MEVDRSLKLNLDPDDGIYRELHDLVRAFDARGRSLRLIGGLAILNHLQNSRHARPVSTFDFDSVIRPQDCASQEEAIQLASHLEEIRQDLEYTVEQGTGRLERCRFAHPSKPFKFDLLCSTLRVGKLTDQHPPKWRLVRNRLYAAHNEALDWLREECWITVEAMLADARFEYEIPDPPAMLILKAKAVWDKLQRLAEAPEEARTREYDQLLKHAQDLVLMRNLIDDEGIAPLASCGHSHRDKVRDIARQSQMRVIELGEVVDDEGLADLVSGSHTPLLDALDV